MSFIWTGAGNDTILRLYRFNAVKYRFNRQIFLSHVFAFRYSNKHRFSLELGTSFNQFPVNVSTVLEHKDHLFYRYSYRTLSSSSIDLILNSFRVGYTFLRCIFMKFPLSVFVSLPVKYQPELASYILRVYTLLCLCSHSA